MNKQRKFILIAAAAGAVSVFLPWITISAAAMGYNLGSRSENGFHSSGVAYFILMAAAGVIAAVIGDRARTLDKTMRLVTLACGLAGVLCVFLYFKDGPDGIQTGYGGVDVSPSIGAFTAVLAALSVLILPLVFKNPGESLQADFEHLKQKVKSINTGTTIPPPADKPATNSSTVNHLDELDRIIKLREEGKINDEEYARMKAKIL